LSHVAAASGHPVQCGESLDHHHLEHVFYRGLIRYHRV